MWRILCIVAVACSAQKNPTRFPNVPIAPDYNAGIPQETASTIGSITDFALNDGIFGVSCGSAALRLQFFREDIVRVWLAWDGEFSDPAAGIVVGKPDLSVKPVFVDEGDHYVMRAFAGSLVTLHASKSPFKLSMFLGDDLVWSESQGLSRNSSTTFQTLTSDAGEHYFGGGMQNGRFSHKGARIHISADGNWDEGGNPNAAPVYMSSAGYAVYRNTWKPGFYDFSSHVTTGHNEQRFDAFFMVSAPKDFKALLGAYTYLTGPPFMPPAYALGLGDSDCYHNQRHGFSTHKVLDVAKNYRDNDMPGAWFLPNDGYGCGYGEDPSDDFPSDFDVLDDVVSKLHDDGFFTGLWSSTGLPNMEREVAGSGVRIAKTDVGWIGNGYKYAFDSVKLCSDGIEDNSDGRRFIWTVEGWAGTHRMAVMWTGDNSGNFDYIRWQIPTFIGCGFSAQAHVSGDIDGIFGGSPETQVRDLQFKSFMTVMMTMSGWASNPDKQPWTWGEPYTTINRNYLKLKMRLTPYFYSLSRHAYDTGVPPIRAMALEFANDTTTYSPHVGSMQQFMAGSAFLVAPVYTSLSQGGSKRDGIYLPAGNWVDYWDYSIKQGPTTIDDYDAPLEKLPVFVQAGSIIPMWPEMLYAGEKPVDTLTLDIYPEGNSEFELYEDDGVTRQALESSAFAKTRITAKAGSDALRQGGDVTVDVAATKGSFTGQLSERAYSIQVHVPSAPATVMFDEQSLDMHTCEELGSVESGWCFGAGPSPMPPAPTPPPTPPGVNLLHKGRACQYQTVNLGNSFSTPEKCAAAANANSECHGYFMHSASYWDVWGCRCCVDDKPEEYNDAWNMYQYSLDTDHSSAGNTVIVKTPSTSLQKAFTVKLKAASKATESATTTPMPSVLV